MNIMLNIKITTLMVFSILGGLANASTLSGTSEGVGPTKLDACKNAKQSASLEADTARYRASSKQNVKEVVIDDCLCDQAVPPIYKCIVDYKIKLSDK